jgi:outer membrane protein insertion porin family
MLFFLIVLFPIMALSKVFVISNYPLPKNNIEKVVNEDNYLDIVEVIKHIEGIKDVSIKKEGEDIYIYIERYPILKKVIIKGNLFLWKDTIMSRLGLYEGMPIKEISRENIQERLERLYRDEGFLDAKVGVTLDITQDGYIYLNIGIEEGDIYFTGGGIYEGATFKSDKLSRAIQIVKGRVANESQFEEKVFALQDFYIDEGYLDSFVYFKGIRKEETKEPFLRVLFPVDDKIEKKPISMVGYLLEGLSNLFRHPVGTLKAISGRGHIAYPIFNIIEGNKYSITFEGAVFFKPEELLNTSELKEKGVDIFSLEEAKENIESAYRKKGFFDISVSYKAKGSNVVFYIKEGQRYTALLENTEFPYDEDKISLILEERLNRLKKEGYTLAEGSFNLSLDREKKKAYVELVINKGKKQILKEMLYQGDDKKLAKIFRQYNDMLPTIYDTHIIEKLNLDIKKYLQEMGYMEGDFNTNVLIDESADSVYYTYTYTVNKGPRYKLGQDIYYGYLHTSARELSYMTVKDEFYSEKDNDRTLSNFISSDLFSGVKIDTFLDKETKKVHRLIQLSEDKRGIYDISLGYNTQEKVVLDTFLGWKNLFGIGLNTNFHYRKTGKRELYSLDISDNFLFTRKLWLKTYLFNNYEKHLSYTLTSKGMSSSVGYRITDNTSVGITLSRTTNSALGEVIDLYKYGVFLLREYKDNLFSPQRVHYDSINLSRAIGDREYTKFELSTFYLIPLRRGINLSFKVAGGYVGKSAPIFDRFFLGGLRDLRGYSFESVGQPDGGRYYAFGRVEFEFPIKSPFVIIAFADAGNVGDKLPHAIRNPKKDVGASVGIKTPVGPIRFDVAFPLGKDIPRRLRLYLSVGYYY